eukprot:gnl/TRDRNA2_/TRDRNA2_84714_c0_seq1.p1 gnl/TRDRNA2_/TRDRNA2_84714_c0~~gnl/TRDRNA2_/TRDRNA2_84714_c0_seq1.p1  ORF type:complete len:336 (-),score=33.22 gnl/TRDRNA2_/TRDRNA2_84714_c0_seq1:77-1084(-)
MSISAPTTVAAPAKSGSYSYGSYTYAAPTTGYGSTTYAAPTTVAVPEVTYAAPATYAAPVTYAAPATYAAPVTYAAPAPAVTYAAPVPLTPEPAAYVAPSTTYAAPTHSYVPDVKSVMPSTGGTITPSYPVAATYGAPVMASMEKPVAVSMAPMEKPAAAQPVQTVETIVRPQGQGYQSQYVDYVPPGTVAAVPPGSGAVMQHPGYDLPVRSFGYHEPGFGGYGPPPTYGFGGFGPGYRGWGGFDDFGPRRFGPFFRGPHPMEMDMMMEREMEIEAFHRDRMMMSGWGGMYGGMGRYGDWRRPYMGYRGFGRGAFGSFGPRPGFGPGMGWGSGYF